MFDEASNEWKRGNVQAAFRLFKSAAQGGHPGAQQNLGYFYDEVEGVEKSREEALYWYKKAALSDRGNYTPHINVALLYNSMGKTRRAKEWLRKAVAGGDGDAALELAKIYLRSRLHSVRMRAIEYLSIAVESQHITEESKLEARNILLRQSNSKDMI